MWRAAPLEVAGSPEAGGVPDSELDHCWQANWGACLKRQTMSLALPESMREYSRELVRRDQEEQAKKRLRDHIEEGLASGPGRRRTKADEKELMAIARGEID